MVQKSIYVESVYVLKYIVEIPDEGLHGSFLQKRIFLTHQSFEKFES